MSIPTIFPYMKKTIEYTLQYILHIYIYILIFYRSFLTRRARMFRIMLITAFLTELGAVAPIGYSKSSLDYV